MLKIYNPPRSQTRHCSPQQHLPPKCNARTTAHQQTVARTHQLVQALVRVTLTNERVTHPTGWQTEQTNKEPSGRMHNWPRSKGAGCDSRYSVQLSGIIT